jgi:hypothetical protein
MNRSVVTQLVLKDLYFARWIVAASVVAGLVSLAVMPMSPVATYVGAVTLICTIVVLNIVLVMAIAQEKKDKVLLFFLSLPVSTAQYTLSKVLSNSIAFTVPWIVFTLGTVVVVDASALPNGSLPSWLAILVYLLMYYCVLLAVVLVSDSTGAHAAAITIGNISVNFLIPLVLGLPSTVANRQSATAVWTSDIVVIIAVELLVAVTALGAGFYLRSRATDFV